MKMIPLREEVGSRFKSKDIIKQVLENSPTKPMTIPEMRVRSKILDKLEAVTENFLLLEDEHHRVLKEAMQTFPWSICEKSLLLIIEDIESPKDHLASVEKKGSKE